MMNVITMRMDEKLLYLLDYEAESSGETRSALIRRYIDQGLEASRCDAEAFLDSVRAHLADHPYRKAVSVIAVVSALLPDKLSSEKNGQATRRVEEALVRLGYLHLQPGYFLHQGCFLWFEGKYTTPMNYEL
jgi:hypothetical protein